MLSSTAALIMSGNSVTNAMRGIVGKVPAPQLPIPDPRLPGTLFADLSHVIYSRRSSVHRNPRVGSSGRRYRHHRYHRFRPVRTRRYRVCRASRTGPNARRGGHLRKRRKREDGERSVRPRRGRGDRGQRLAKGPIRARQHRPLPRRLPSQDPGLEPAFGPPRCRRVWTSGELTRLAYVPHTEADRQAMLAAIGAKSIDELFREIPDSLRIKPGALNLPPALDEG